MFVPPIIQKTIRSILGDTTHIGFRDFLCTVSYWALYGPLLSPIPASSFCNAAKSAILRLASAVLLLFALPSFSTFGADYYVATNGDDANAGTLAEPFRTLGHAVSQIASGDTLYIRGGTYRYVLARDNQVMMTLTNRTASTTTTIRHYNDEEVILSGARVITGPWTQHSGHIWTTNIWSDDGDDSTTLMCTVFLNGEMLTGARWPNRPDFDRRTPISGKEKRGLQPALMPMKMAKPPRILPSYR